VSAGEAMQQNLKGGEVTGQVQREVGEGRKDFNKPNVAASGARHADVGDEGTLIGKNDHRKTTAQRFPDVDPTSIGEGGPILWRKGEGLGESKGELKGGKKKNRHDRRRGAWYY